MCTVVHIYNMILHVLYMLFQVHRGTNDLFSYTSAQASSVNVVPYCSVVDKSLSKFTIYGKNLTVGFQLRVIHCSIQCMNTPL